MSAPPLEGHFIANNPTTGTGDFLGLPNIFLTGVSVIGLNVGGPLVDGLSSCATTAWPLLIPASIQETP